MRRGEPLDQFLALVRQGEEDFAAIIGGNLAYHRLAHDQLVDDADGAVVPDLELFGQVSHGEFALRGGGADGQEGLVLVWGEVFGAKKIFAETEELPHLVAEGGECLKVHGIQGYVDILISGLTAGCKHFRELF